MVGLLDIAPLERTVTIRDEQITVRGISGEGLVTLLAKFPEIRKVMTNRGNDVTADDWIKLAPSAVVSAIAAGCGYPGIVEAEDRISALGVGEQLMLLDAIFKLTFPEGVGPFVERLTQLVDSNTVGLVAPGWAPDTKSPEPSSSASLGATPRK